MFTLILILGGAFVQLDWLWFLNAAEWEKVDRFALIIGLALALLLDIAIFSIAWAVAEKVN